jgi:lipid A ethanolaminephosphotransferase
MLSQDITQGVQMPQIITRNGKKNLLVLVLGESARGQNFSLNGYHRATNEPLEDFEILSYRHVNSCGTSTFHSISCIFSHMDRESFQPLASTNSSNLLYILQKFQFYIRWSSNNGGCNGVCNRVKYISTSGLSLGEYDEFLTNDFKRVLRTNFSQQNILLILHQKGSHLPYQEKYPDSFEKFKPTCKESPENCTLEEILNSYDNSIYYTSYNIASLIEILQNNDNYNTLLWYVSDHGDAPGENGFWAHPIPYDIAPSVVKEVPMLLGISREFATEFYLDRDCLHKKLNDQLSHDNIFHSILGLFGIKSNYYNKNLDIFNSCCSRGGTAHLI